MRIVSFTAPSLSLAALLLMSVCFTGCNISMGIPGSGTLKSESRQVGSFDSIAIDGIGDLEVTVGSEDSLEISTDDNLLEFVETKVAGGILTISCKESISPSKSLKIIATTTMLKKLEVDGVASVDVKDVSGESFEVNIEGAASVSANGSVTSLTVEVDGVGSANLKELKSADAKVDISGAASAEVFASESVDAKVDGVGSISVYGKPADVEKSVDGVGSITVKE